MTVKSLKEEILETEQQYQKAKQNKTRSIMFLKNRLNILRQLLTDSKKPWKYSSQINNKKPF